MDNMIAMHLMNQCLADIMAEKARQVNIEFICLGLGYTVVTTSDGCIGLAYTYFDHKTGCSLVSDYQDFEGRPATELLALIHSSDPLDRSMALALVNALTFPDVEDLPSDRDNGVLFDALGICASTKVAMVGFFKPLVGILESKGAIIEVLDEFRAMGTKEAFYPKLGNWADAVLITSTTLLNNTFEEIVNQIGAKVRAALLGPSTPMVADAFLKWPTIRALAGTVPVDKEQILKTVRHGLGTPYLHRHSKKVTLTLQDNHKNEITN